MGGTRSMGGARNRKQQREQLVSSLRDSGSSWVEVAEALRGHFRVNPRVAHAYLGRDELEAVGEHFAPILRSTGTEYRTVPVIGRTRSLHTLLGERTDLVSGTLTILREDLAGFITHPAPTPLQLDPGTPT